MALQAGAEKLLDEFDEAKSGWVLGGGWASNKQRMGKRMMELKWTFMQYKFPSSGWEAEKPSEAEAFTFCRREPPPSSLKGFSPAQLPSLLSGS